MTTGRASKVKMGIFGELQGSQVSGERRHTIFAGKEAGVEVAVVPCLFIN